MPTTEQIENEAANRLDKIIEGISSLKYFCSYYDYTDIADRLTNLIGDFGELELELKYKIRGENLDKTNFR